MAARPGEVSRVLVVEDDAMLGRLIEMGLGPHALVTVCRSGQEALAALGNHIFDAVTIDIGLPDMSGLEVIDQARRALPEAGILAITGLVDVAVAVGAMKAGADDFIGKPFQPDFLWHALTRASENRHRQIEADRAEAYRTLAYTDALTGCPNRRLVDEYLVTAMEHSARYCEPLTVAYLDVDNFKLLNDVLGYDRGDAVLSRVAALLATVVRDPAVFGRFGGDEFVAVFPGTTTADAEFTLEKFKLGIAADESGAGGRESLPIRVSIGLAPFRGYESPRELIAEAEDQMHLSKSATHALLGAALEHSNSDAILKVTNLKALRNLVKAIDRRDRYTRFHSDHATRVALLVAGEVGVAEDVLRAISVGGPIHDLGKIVVPDEILRKPGALTTEERHSMEEHPVVGAAITAAVTDAQTVVDLVRHHHERFDGGGYPAGLKGAEISQATRIFTLADAYSAMTTDRPYRRGLSIGEALAEVSKNRGTQFDPDLAVAFCTALERLPATDAAA